MAAGNHKVAAGNHKRREGAGREQSTAAREQPPLARDILHKTILANQAAFEQKLAEIMLTKQGALQVLELLAKLNREIGSRADEAPAVRIVIGGNIPLDGMRAVTPPALPAAPDPDAIPDP